MRLHEDKTLFRQAVTATAGLLDIPEIFIEKHYWVTYSESWQLLFSKSTSSRALLWMMTA